MGLALDGWIRGWPDCRNSRWAVAKLHFVIPEALPYLNDNSPSLNEERKGLTQPQVGQDRDGRDPERVRQVCRLRPRVLTPGTLTHKLDALAEGRPIQRARL